MWRTGATSPARGRFLLVLSTTCSQNINCGFIAPTSVLRDKHVTEEEEEEEKKEKKEEEKKKEEEEKKKKKMTKKTNSNNARYEVRIVVLLNTQVFWGWCRYSDVLKRLA